MSCILVGLSTLRIHPERLTLSDLIWCVSRDTALLAWYVTLMTLAMIDENRGAIERSRILPWLILNLLVTVLRLIRTPLQFKANDILHSQYPSWESLYNNRTWTFYFSERFHLCQMRLYSFIDWCTYFVWVFGAWTVRSDYVDGSIFVVSASHWEIAISTILYVSGIVFYVFIFTFHRVSQGWCCPGLQMTNDEWPDMCPSFGFDTRLWRQAGEERSAYRRRVREHFVSTEYFFTQPMPNAEMTPEVGSLSQLELSQLRTFSYDPEAAKPKVGRLPAANTTTVIEAPTDQVEETTVTEQIAESETVQTDVESLQQADISIAVDLEPPVVAIIEPNIPTENLTVTQVDYLKTTDETCALCIEDYSKGDLLRELHCGHRFHSDCVDEWLLETKRVCPVCNGDALGEDKFTPV